MKQTSKRLVSILGSLGLVVIALVVFFDIVQPEYDTIAQTKGTIVGENAILQTETQAVTAAQKVISEYQNDSAGQAAVNLALPGKEDLAGALAQVYGLAQNNGIVVQGITVSASAGQKAGGTTAAATVKPFGVLSLQISAGGSYESLKNFLAGIETNIRIFDLKGLSISAAPGKGAGGGQNFFNYNITVATYYQTN